MIDIQRADFDVGEEYRQLRQASGSVGAIACFTGLVRDLDNNTPVVAMELEHYPGMTESALQRIIEQAQQRWDIDTVRIIHRVGRLQADDQIVFVGVSSTHRDQAFDACHFIMDYLKTGAPFWKKEVTPAGEHWVEQKASDRSAARKWEN